MNLHNYAFLKCVDYKITQNQNTKQTIIQFFQEFPEDNDNIINICKQIEVDKNQFFKNNLFRPSIIITLIEKFKLEKIYKKAYRMLYTRKMYEEIINEQVRILINIDKTETPTYIKNLTKDQIYEYWIKGTGVSYGDKEYIIDHYQKQFNLNIIEHENYQIIEKKIQNMLGETNLNIKKSINISKNNNNVFFEKFIDYFLTVDLYINKIIFLAYEINFSAYHFNKHYLSHNFKNISEIFIDFENKTIKFYFNHEESGLYYFINSYNESVTVKILELLDALNEQIQVNIIDNRTIALFKDFYNTIKKNDLSTFYPPNYNRKELLQIYLQNNSKEDISILEQLRENITYKQMESLNQDEVILFLSDEFFYYLYEVILNITITKYHEFIEKIFNTNISKLYQCVLNESQLILSIYNKTEEEYKIYIDINNKTIYFQNLNELYNTSLVGFYEFFECILSTQQINQNNKKIVESIIDYSKHNLADQYLKSTDLFAFRYFKGDNVFQFLITGFQNISTVTMQIIIDTFAKILLINYDRNNVNADIFEGLTFKHFNKIKIVELDLSFIQSLFPKIKQTMKNIVDIDTTENIRATIINAKRSIYDKENINAQILESNNKICNDLIKLLNFNLGYKNTQLKINYINQIPLYRQFNNINMKQFNEKTIMNIIKLLLENNIHKLEKYQQILNNENIQTQIDELIKTRQKYKYNNDIHIIIKYIIKIEDFIKQIKKEVINTISVQSILPNIVAKHFKPNLQNKFLNSLQQILQIIKNTPRVYSTLKSIQNNQYTIQNIKKTIIELRKLPQNITEIENTIDIPILSKKNNNKMIIQEWITIQHNQLSDFKDIELSQYNTIQNIIKQQNQQVFAKNFTPTDEILKKLAKDIIQCKQKTQIIFIKNKIDKFIQSFLKFLSNIVDKYICSETDNQNILKAKELLDQENITQGNINTENLINKFNIYSKIPYNPINDILLEFDSALNINLCYYNELSNIKWYNNSYDIYTNNLFHIMHLYISVFTSLKNYYLIEYNTDQSIIENKQTKIDYSSQDHQLIYSNYIKLYNFIIENKNIILNNIQQYFLENLNNTSIKNQAKNIIQYNLDKFTKLFQQKFTIKDINNFSILKNIYNEIYMLVNINNSYKFENIQKEDYIKLQITNILILFNNHMEIDSFSKQEFSNFLNFVINAINVDFQKIQQLIAQYQNMNNETCKMSYKIFQASKIIIKKQLQHDIKLINPILYDIIEKQNDIKILIKQTFQGTLMAMLNSKINILDNIIQIINKNHFYILNYKNLIYQEFIDLLIQFYKIEKINNTIKKDDNLAHIYKIYSKKMQSICISNINQSIFSKIYEKELIDIENNKL